MVVAMALAVEVEVGVAMVLGDTKCFPFIDLATVLSRRGCEQRSGQESCRKCTLAYQVSDLKEEGELEKKLSSLRLKIYYDM
ncbi:hypothetical protein AAFF_G00327780 [Aldrovandia affinis]|uniref:Uncharacterized protein n=1 Tax=Aldrovandia affinis TaxID=143900 RepID=A0AAD7T9I4_9TELE|nr:hypothetical protein AAFF_G00327780 [Aldrovandia affinis]